MKKFILLQCFFLATIVTTVAQDIPFTPLFQQTVKGDMIIVGNAILNKGDSRPANAPYNGDHDNSRINMEYTDVDNDLSTFNSSSADVKEPVSTCNKRVIKAYLYWAAAYTQERVDNQRNPRLERSKFGQVKFKIGNGAYHNLVGHKVYDGNHIVSSTGWDQNKGQRAYVYRADVTNLLTNIGATYTVADLSLIHI